MILCLCLGYLDDEYKGGDMNGEEFGVDMEGELISVLKEIDRLRLKKKKK
jgi:hypothetical protein